jgi:hypothetical protein
MNMKNSWHGANTQIVWSDKEPVEIWIERELTAMVKTWPTKKPLVRAVLIAMASDLNPHLKIDPFLGLKLEP